MTLRNIIFDFDGTLGDSKGCGNIATQEAFEHFNLKVPAAETMEYYMGIPIEESFKKMANRELSDTEFKNLLDEFRRLYKHYEADYLTLFPGTKEMLASLTKAGKQLFVASSKHSEALRRNLEILGIAEFFTEVVGSDLVTHYKPHPESIDFIVNKHSLERTETVMVGDAVFDLQMGKAASVRTCAVTWGSHSEEALRTENPDFVAHDNRELTQILTEN
ncbi:HAD family hydrolase [Lactovum odontotermitis]